MKPLGGWVFVLAAASGCSRASSAPSTAQLEAGVSMIRSPVSKLDDAAATAPPPGSDDPQTPPNAVLSRVLEWNRALSAHDVDALERLYASRLCFYGKLSSRAQVVEVKRKALGDASTYVQEIVGPVTLQHGGPNASIVATFTKRSGAAGQLRDVTARLVLGTFGSDDGPDTPWLLVAENDDSVANPTRDACESSAAYSKENVPKEDTQCETVASEVVHALPAVRKVIAETLEVIRGKPQLSLGGFGPEPGPDRSFNVVIGINSPERIEPIASYTVNRKTGALQVSAEGVDVELSPAAKSAVENACKE